MTCILKRAKRYRVTLRMDPPRGNFDLTVTSVSQSQAAAAALHCYGLGPDRLLHIEQTEREKAT